VRLRTFVKWTVSLALAAPLVVMSVQLLRTGEVALGVGFLAFSVVVLLLPEYLQRRLGAKARRTVEKVPLLGRLV